MHVSSALESSEFALQVPDAPSSRRCGLVIRVTRTLGRASLATLLALQIAPLTMLGQQATPAAKILSFDAAAVGITPGSAQTLTASFAVSGISGGFTPT